MRQYAVEIVNKNGTKRATWFENVAAARMMAKDIMDVAEVGTVVNVWTERGLKNVEPAELGVFWTGTVVEDVVQHLLEACGVDTVAKMTDKQYEAFLRMATGRAHCYNCKSASILQVTHDDYVECSACHETRPIKRYVTTNGGSRPEVEFALAGPCSACGGSNGATVCHASHEGGLVMGVCKPCALAELANDAVEIDEAALAEYRRTGRCPNAGNPLAHPCPYCDGPNELVA